MMTLEEARLLANVNERARWLYEQGYRAKWTDDRTVTVKTPSGTTYTIDHADSDDAGETNCSCPFFAGREGRLGCKHLLGYRLLLMRVQQARARAWAEYACHSLAQWQRLRQRERGQTR